MTMICIAILSTKERIQTSKKYGHYGHLVQGRIVLLQFQALLWERRGCQNKAQLTDAGLPAWGSVTKFFVN